MNNRSRTGRRSRVVTLATIASLSLLAPMALTEAVADEPNASEALEFANPGFEGAEMEGVPEGWTQRYTTDTGGFELVDDPTRTGDGALRIFDTSTTATEGMLSDPVDVVPGTTYEVGAWALVDQGVPSWILNYYDAEGTQIEQVSHRVRVAPGDWTWESEITVAPDEAASARLLLYSSSADVTDTVWDDLRIQSIEAWEEESLGHQVEAANILDSAYGVGEDGKAKLYTVTAAMPAQFQVLDVETGALEASAELPSSGLGSWSVLTASDGTVYVGAYNNGRLSRWLPESETLVDVGRVSETATYVWTLAEDEHGTIWGGTYPGAELFSYDPATDTFTNHGGLSDQEYARSIAVVDDTVYVGLGSTSPKIIAHDIATGEQREILLPEEFQGDEFVYELDAREHLLVARVNPAGATLLYDTESETWIDGLGQTSFGTVSPVGPDGSFYFIDAAGELTEYDITTAEITGTGVEGLLPGRGFGWVELEGEEFPGQTLVTIYQTGEIVKYNPETGESSTVVSEAEKAPIRLQTVAIGPDQKVYTSGYMYEGLTAFDPETGDTEVFPRDVVGQVEGMLAHDGDLYIGSYTSANLFRFDVDEAWEDEGNPDHLATLGERHQDRPFAWTSADDLVVTGTVPRYGLLGGVLAVYDPAADALEVHENFIEDQSISALTSIDGIVYGSTSIFGGLGAVPTADAGVVFAWDPESGEKLWENEINPDAEAITSIQAGPDGTLWAIDVGTLYELDPANGEVLRSTTLVPYQFAGASMWVSADIAFNEVGEMYALSRGTVFSIDPETLSLRKLATGASNYALAVTGRDIYFLRGDELVRLRGPEIEQPDPGAISATSAGTKLVGNATNVWGDAEGLAGETAVAEALVDGEWVEVGSATVADDDSYVIELSGDAVASAGEYTLRVRVGEIVSEEFSFERVARTGFGAANFAPTGREANVWGTVDGSAKVSTQVYVPGRGWSTSQVAETDANGWFAIPLTYGANSAGEYRWRVVVEHEHGEREFLRDFTQTRVAGPSATTAGSAPTGREANVWGTASGTDSVWTEVQLPDGRWSRSQVVEPDSGGGYVIPLTYGQHTPGAYQWRVVADHPEAGTLYGEVFSFVRH